jgi:hypothetical protein
VARRFCPRRGRAWRPLVKNRLRTRWSKVDLEAQDAVFEGGRCVTQHREVLEVQVGRVNDALSLRSFDRRESTAFDGLGPFTESKHHLVGIKGRAHAAMIGASCEFSVGIMDIQLSTPGLWSPPVMARDQ